MRTWLRQTIVPLSILVILSSCLILAWQLYRTIYIPLFNDAAPTITASDYAVPTTKLDSTLTAMDVKAESAVDFSGVPKPFIAPEN